MVVKLAGAQTITGVKTFSAQPKFDTAIAIKEGTSGTLTGYTCIGANTNQLLIGVVGATHTFTFPTSSSYTYTLPSGTGTLALTSDIPSLTGYVTLATNQTITGDKYFTGFTSFNVNQVLFGGGIALNNTTSGGAVSGHTVLGANADGLQVNLSGGAYNNLKFANTSTGRNYTFPDASGTLALSSDLSSYVPTSRTLTINGTTYDLSANRSWTIAAGISGSGTTNYVPKFTSGSAIGNSLIFDDGTNVGIGTASPTFKLDVSGTGRFSDVLTVNSSSTSSNLNILSLLQPSFAATYGAYLSIGNANSTNNSGALQFNYVSSGSDSNTINLSLYGKSGLTINGSGNVGIGTSTPTSARLQVSGSNSQAIAYFYNNSGTAGSVPGVAIEGGTNASDYALSVASSLGTSYLRVRGDGNIGIGTTAPTDKLVVSNAGANTLHFDVEYSGGASTIYSYNRSTSAYTNLQLSASNIIFQSGGTTERMRITSGGLVGIGTSSPTNKLTLYNTVSYNQVNDQLRLIGNNSGGGSSSTPSYNGGIAFTQDATDFAYIRSIQSNPANAWTSRLGFWTLNGNGGTPIERMSIDNNGNVGIGTTAPSGAAGLALAINGGASQTRIALKNSFTGDAAADGFQILLDAGSADVALEIRETGSMRFATSDTERMRITSAGNLLVGLTSSTYETTNRTSIVANGTSSSLFGLVVGGVNKGYMFADGTNILLMSEAASGFMSFGTNNTERMRITSGGDVCINATATSGSAKLYVNGLAVFGSVQVGSLGTGTVYSSSGTLTNTNPSDKRLKENITPITYGLNEILKLNPVSFDWKNDNNKNKQFGFIAQEVQKVMPEAVIEGEYLGLEKDAIYTALINAIKELKAEIDELKNK